MRHIVQIADRIAMQILRQ